MCEVCVCVCVCKRDHIHYLAVHKICLFILEDRSNFSTSG